MQSDIVTGAQTPEKYKKEKGEPHLFQGPRRGSSGAHYGWRNGQRLTPMNWVPTECCSCTAYYKITGDEIIQDEIRQSSLLVNVKCFYT